MNLRLIAHMTLITLPLLLIDWHSLYIILLTPLCVYFYVAGRRQTGLLVLIAANVVLAFSSSLSLIYLLLLIALIVIYYSMAEPFPLLLYIQLFYVVHVIFNPAHREIAILYGIHALLIIILMVTDRSTKDIKPIIFPVIALIIGITLLKFVYPFIIQQVPVDWIRKFDFEIRPLDKNDDYEKMNEELSKNREIPKVESTPKTNPSFYYIVGSIALAAAAFVIYKFRNAFHFLPTPAVSTPARHHQFRNEEFDFRSSLPKSYIRQFRRLEKAGLEHSIYYVTSDTFHDYLSRFNGSEQLLQLFNDCRYSSNPADQSKAVKSEVSKIIRQLEESQQ
ncbi:hypothetical protein [Macrococcus lamae]|uniref:DUF4129 domain-containing protein n=1 Tax=Macrococcus lamae TaxID=198484 RepID=A0A4R6BSJ5_9STAP|nr:hypothetical protein [Macrococcus lamae]TDM07115.1 hypothetical protein ERX29_09500 [Macrococcus lamae]